jgi:hypothetical protein
MNKKKFRSKKLHKEAYTINKFSASYYIMLKTRKNFEKKHILKISSQKIIFLIEVDDRKNSKQEINPISLTQRPCKTTFVSARPYQVE